MKNKLILTFIFFAFTLPALAQNNGERIYYVVDNAHILTDEQVSSLTKQIKEFERSFGSQIAVLTIKSLNGEKIEDFSLKTAESWGLGREDYNDGILITVSLQDRQMRIEVGRGLEKIIKNEMASQIIKEEMTPNFKAGNFYEGLRLAVLKITELITHNKNLIGQPYK